MRILIRSALVLTMATVATLAVTPGGREAAIRASLQEATPPGRLDAEVNRALDAGDVAGALQYAGLASELGKPLAAATEARLADAQSTAAVVWRGVGDFAGGYLTGEADSAAGLAGAVVSDLTVVGDVRDLVSEGAKAATGFDYSEFVLALAAVGIAAEGVTIATGGGSLVAKAAISTLKVAKRTGNLTAEFTWTLLATARRATAAAGARRAGRAAAGGSAGGSGRALARAELAATFAAVGRIADHAGPAETVRLLRHVHSSDELQEIATMSARFGPRTRAVIELTGKTSLRAFRLGLKAVTAIVWGILGFLGWLGGLVLFAAIRRSGKAVLRGCGHVALFAAAAAWRLAGGKPPLHIRADGRRRARRRRSFAAGAFSG